MLSGTEAHPTIENNETFTVRQGLVFKYVNLHCASSGMSLFNYVV